MNSATQITVLVVAITLGNRLPATPPMDPLAADRADDPNYQTLPEEFPVWTGSFGVLNHGNAGGTRKILRTNNDDSRNPGCYVACYSQKRRAGIYPVGQGIFVVGQLRTAGKYQGRICKPLGYEKADISKSEKFKTLCRQKVRNCGDTCWGGGDTGGWFGIP